MAHCVPNWHLRKSQRDCQWKQCRKVLAISTVSGLKKPEKISLKAVAAPPNISERTIFQKTLKLWSMWPIIVHKIMIAYFLLMQTHLLSLPVLYEALLRLAQVRQRKQLHIICVVFLTADSCHGQHTTQLSSDRITPLAFDKQKAVLPRHRNMLLYDIFHFPTHTCNVAFWIQITKLSRSTCSQRNKLYLPVINQSRRFK